MRRRDRQRKRQRMEAIWGSQESESQHSGQYGRRRRRARGFAREGSRNVGPGRRSIFGAPARPLRWLLVDASVSQLGDGERHIINEDTPSKPSYKRTWPFALCFYVISLFGSRASSETEEAETPAQSEPQTAEKGNGKARASSSSSSSSDGEGEEEEVKSAGGARGVKKATAVAVGKTAGGRRRKGGKR